MKFLVNMIALVLFMWPALFVGYIVEALVTGFVAGRELFDEHCRSHIAWVDSVKKGAK